MGLCPGPPVGSDRPILTWLSRRAGRCRRRAAVEPPTGSWLQVIQWMAEHACNNPGAYSYHRCAHLKITADESLPLDEGWPAQH